MDLFVIHEDQRENTLLSQGSLFVVQGSLLIISATKKISHAITAHLKINVMRQQCFSPKKWR